MLQLVFTAWARGRNGKPRNKWKGETPIATYFKNQPSPQDIHAARAWIGELQRRQEHFQATRAARREPVRLQLLAEELAGLHIPDPDSRLAQALAGYEQEAIARGLAVFRTKQQRNTLPPDADAGRYLGGIIRQLHIRFELEAFSQHILEQRLRLGDLTLAPLSRAAQQLRATASPAEWPQALVDQCLDATTTVDARYWAQLAAESLSIVPIPQRTPRGCPEDRGIWPTCPR